MTTGAIWILEGYCHDGDSECSGYVLGLNKTEISIGRQGADIRIEDKSVSRSHAKFLVTNDDLRLTDSESKFGTFHNGSRLGGFTACVEGDIISFGACSMKFRLKNLALGPIYATADIGVKLLSKLRMQLANRPHDATTIVVGRPSLEESQAILALKSPRIFTRQFMEALADGHYRPALNDTTNLEPPLLSGLSSVPEVTFRVAKEGFSPEQMAILHKIISQITCSSSPHRTLIISKTKGPLDNMSLQEFFQSLVSGHDITHFLGSNETTNDALMTWVIREDILRGISDHEHQPRNDFKRFRKYHPRDKLPPMIHLGSAESFTRAPQPTVRTPKVASATREGSSKRFKSSLFNNIPI